MTKENAVWLHRELGDIAYTAAKAMNELYMASEHLKIIKCEEADEKISAIIDEKIRLVESARDELTNLCMSRASRLYTLQQCGYDGSGFGLDKI